jgi:hypothetical protein
MAAEGKSVMAKAKKTETKTDAADAQPAKAPTAAAPAAKKAPAVKKPAAAAGKPAKSGATAGGSGGGTPMVDTNLAAQAAAKMLMNRAVGGPASTTPQKESGAFKQMKDALNKPQISGPGGPVTGGGHHRSNLPHQFQKQKGHNQTFGADVNRTGVPRRTPG